MFNVCVFQVVYTTANEGNDNMNWAKQQADFRIRASALVLAHEE